LIQIRIIENQEWAVSTQLKCDLLQSICAVLCDQLSDPSLDIGQFGVPDRSGPPLTDPVKVTFFTSGCRQRASLNGGVFSKLVVRTLKTPFGNPACCARFANARTESGVSGEGLTIIVHPAAKAALAFRKIIAIGKFHGTRAAVTPIGCFTVKTLRPGADGVWIVPVILSASPANHHVKPRA